MGAKLTTVLIRAIAQPQAIIRSRQARSTGCNPMDLWVPMLRSFVESLSLLLKL
jgi:hypothetical protein